MTTSKSLAIPKSSSRWLRSRRLVLGRDRGTGKRLAIPASWLAYHLYAIGTTGKGKTYFLYRLFQMLTAIPGASLTVLDPKSDLFTLCRDFAFANGLGQRTVVWDPGDRQRVLAWNPLKPVEPDRPIKDCKRLKDTLLYSTGNTDLNLTAQLDRYMLAALIGARALKGGTLTEALDIIRIDSSLREQAIAAMRRERAYTAYATDLEEYDKLPVSLKHKVTNPTVARLQRFIGDPTIRYMLTQERPGFELDRHLATGGILLANFQKHGALQQEDASLLGRLLIAQTIAHAFKRPKGNRPPCFLVVDECHDFMTPLLADVASQGRSLGLHLILAHQAIADFEDQQLFERLMANMRTKVIFGLASQKDAEYFAGEVAITAYDPRRVRDPRFARVVRTLNTTIADGTSLALPHLIGDGQSEQDTTQHSLTLQANHTHARGKSQQRPQLHTDAHGVSRPRLETQSVTTTPVEPFLLLGTVGGDPLTEGSALVTGEIPSEMHATTGGVVDGESVQDANGVGIAGTIGGGKAKGKHHLETKGVVPSKSHTKSQGRGVNVEPLSKEDFVTLAGLALRKQADASCLVQLPRSDFRFLLGLRAREFALTEEELSRLVAASRGAAMSSTVEQVEFEEERREARLNPPHVESTFNPKCERG